MRSALKGLLSALSGLLYVLTARAHTHVRTIQAYSRPRHSHFRRRLSSCQPQVTRCSILLHPQWFRLLQLDWVIRPVAKQHKLQCWFPRRFDEKPPYASCFIHWEPLYRRVGQPRRVSTDPPLRPDCSQISAGWEQPEPERQLHCSVAFGVLRADEFCGRSLQFC